MSKFYNADPNDTTCQCGAELTKLPKTWQGQPQKWMIARGVNYKGIAPNQMSIFDLVDRK